MVHYGLGVIETTEGTLGLSFGSETANCFYSRSANYRYHRATELVHLTESFMKLLALAGVALLMGSGEPNNVAATVDAAQSGNESDTAERRVETGQVTWLRNLDEAKRLSAKVEKPILILFQEIPG